MSPRAYTVGIRARKPVNLLCSKCDDKLGHSLVHRKMEFKPAESKRVSEIFEKPMFFVDGNILASYTLLRLILCYILNQNRAHQTLCKVCMTSHLYTFMRYSFSQVPAEIAGS